MQIHVGEEIHTVFKEKGWTLEFFAKKINMTTRNAQYIFKRKDISIEQLRSISEAMDYDFVKLFLLDETRRLRIDDPKEHYVNKHSGDMISLNVSLNLSGSQKQYNKLPHLLKEIKVIAEQLGFRVG